jgi:hypothetical protein
MVLKTMDLFLSLPNGLALFKKNIEIFNDSLDVF